MWAGVFGCGFKVMVLRNGDHFRGANYNAAGESEICNNNTAQIIILGWEEPWAPDSRRGPKLGAGAPEQGKA